MIDIVEEIRNRIAKAKKVVIVGHTNADMDCISSKYLMYRYCKELCEDVQLYPSENKDVVWVKQSGMKYWDGKKCDLVIAVDCATEDRLEAKIHDGIDLINIDHHIDNKNYGTLNLVDASACCAGEVIYELIAKNRDITKDEAFYLYTSLAGDTGVFRYNNVTPKAFRLAALVIEKGVDTAYIADKMQQSSYEETMIKAKLIQRINLCGNFAYIKLTREFLIEHHINYERAWIGLEEMRKIEGVEWFVIFIEEEDQISIRFRGKQKPIIDIAHEFGGGGHKLACATIIKDRDFDDVVKSVVTRCKEELGLEL